MRGHFRPIEVTQSLASRFWRKVRKSDGCWVWTGFRNRLGYGMIGAGGGRGRGCYMAHRVSYALANGAIPDGMFVLHRCDNPACARPDHLYCGTQKQNVADMHLRGRARNGFAERTHCPRGHKYTPENTYIYRGSRDCLTCRRRRSREGHEREKERARRSA